jgi:thioredoxin 1
MASAFKSVGAKDFAAEVLEEKGPVVVFFWAPSSEPCRFFIPPLEQHVAERARRPELRHPKLVKVNVEAHPELAAAAKIGGLPALVLYRGGAVADALIGTGGRADVEALFSQA